MEHILWLRFHDSYVYVYVDYIACKCWPNHNPNSYSCVGKRSLSLVYVIITRKNYTIASGFDVKVQLDNSTVEVAVLYFAQSTWTRMHNLSKYIQEIHYMVQITRSWHNRITVRRLCASVVQRKRANVICHNYIMVCVLLFIGNVHLQNVCMRTPSDTAASKTNGDNGFRIKLAGRPPPDKYTPNHVYTGECCMYTSSSACSTMVKINKHCTCKSVDNKIIRPTLCIALS